jgi:8-oxo-dGTP pyrophosphatase MutT (NUDIX family)
MTSEFLAALARELTVRPRVALASSDATAAAVLVPLLTVADDLHVVFTRRAASLPHHQGQVAFPGGTRDAADRDAEATALREAHEEIGLHPDDVRVLGRLDEIETVASRFRITPIVGAVPHPYAWRPCPREVDTVFTVPLATLRAPGIEREELWDFDGRQIPIRLFPVAGQVIWGATHRITRNLLDIVARIIPAPALGAEVPA